MAERKGASGLLAALMDRSNEIGTFGEEGGFPAPVTLAREELGASLTQHAPGTEYPDVLILSRSQAKGLADALTDGVADARFSVEGDDPQPVRVTRADDLITISQKFVENDETDVVQVRPIDARVMAEAIRLWLREVS